MLRDTQNLPDREKIEISIGYTSVSIPILTSELLMVHMIRGKSIVTPHIPEPIIVS